MNSRATSAIASNSSRYTRAFVYVARQPEALPPAARTAIEDARNDLFLSIASPLELQIKLNTGKITFNRPLRQAVQLEVDRGTFQLLPITLAHVEALSALPKHHRDPIDRLLIAQRLHEGLTIVTGDQTIPLYPAPCLWG